MGRIFPFPLRRRRSVGARAAFVAAPATDAGTAPPANAPGGGAVLPFTPRHAPDPIAASCALGTQLARLALTAAFLPAGLALATMAKLAREPQRKP